MDAGLCTWVAEFVFFIAKKGSGSLVELKIFSGTVVIALIGVALVCELWLGTFAEGFWRNACCVVAIDLEKTSEESSLSKNESVGRGSSDISFFPVFCIGFAFVLFSENWKANGKVKEKQCKWINVDIFIFSCYPSFKKKKSGHNFNNNSFTVVLIRGVFSLYKKIKSEKRKWEERK